MATIAVIEDERAIALLVATKLRNAGHEVQVASDGEAGYEMVIDQKPDLVLLDVMLPKVDGYTVCRRLRSHYGTDEGPLVVLLSARSQTSDHLQGFEAGCDDYITKPFRPADLLERVNQLLDGRQRKEQPGP